MKLILAVVEDDDAMLLMDELSQAQIGATKLASTGGFLLQGNTTLMIGVDDEREEDVMRILRRVCVRRKKLLPQTTSELPSAVNLPIEIEAGGAIVFTLQVEQFFHV